MSEFAGEKTEQATPKKLEDAIKRGQFPKSPEVQTVFVIMAGLMALQFSGADIWRQMVGAQVYVFGHLNDIPLTMDAMQGYAVQGVLTITACVGPVLIATATAGLVAGGIQNRFQTASEALDPNWERLNPVEGFKRVFSFKSAVPTLVSIAKLGIIASISYSQIKGILGDPIFTTPVDVARIASFLADSTLKIATRVGIAMIFIAGLDYTYQFWKTNKDLMMTKEEVKDESKNSEGNPKMKAMQRRRRNQKTQRQMLMDVPKADVIVTNPTHIAVALRYDKKTMKAPKIIAKGTRLNALKIREVAAQHQIPIIENKPLARMMFKYGKVGGEVPAELYAAVAEVLAWVYRVNRYRYYAEQNQN